MMFMFWMAWPAAPLPMLSMTELITARLVRLSKVGVMQHRLVPAVHLVWTGLLAGKTWTKGSSL